MTTKVFFLDKDQSSLRTGVFSTRGFRYDLGAQIPEFQAGQSFRATVEKTDDGKTWSPIAVFEMDDANEVIAQQVFTGNAIGLRVVINQRASNALISMWMRLAS